MGSLGVDLVYEMQAELNWDKEFASLACKEYSRWLELRANARDFQFCKLPPSRVVAMVWNLHRQWTFDYEKACAELGGFIHHFPPAMRLSYSREQGYAVTLQTYKSHFREDPPASYWEPPICPSHPDVSPPGLLTQSIGQSRNAEAIPMSGVLPRLRRKSASNAPQTIGVLAEQQVAQEESTRVIPTERTVLSDPAEPLSIAGGTNPIQRHDERRIERNHGDTVEKEAKVVTPLRGGRKGQERFVLRPLAPGEKRKRGRPSMSDYVPVSQLADAHGIRENSALLAGENDREQNVPDGSSPSWSKYASLAIRKKGKSRSPKTKRNLRAQMRRPSQTADDSTLEYTGSTNHGFPTPERIRNTATTRGSDTTGRKNFDESHKQRLPASVRIGPDGSILRRPRGRPRKDGSWPVPRVMRQEVSQSTERRRSTSGLPATSQATKDPSGERGGYLPSGLVTDADIEHGDVPTSNLEGRVCQ